VETGQPGKVLAGELDMFIQAFLKGQAEWNELTSTTLHWLR
jgi:hypothetical protein